MACASCGFENPAGVRFCVECGTALALRCPGCQAEARPGQKFCGECGTPLTATAPPSTASPVTGAVRKTVTVLFADLGGSTGFGERTDPEVSRQVLARYHALLQETIDAHSGTVAKFMGDGMMATFGIPEIAEDDARRAVLAGVDIQRRFESLAADVVARYRETLTLRVGINTGEVVIAAGDADLVGDALNVAARLEKACRPGHVLVGDETWRITRGELAYEPLGEVTVAGRAGPVGTYEVVASGATAAEPVAPFVGRVGETARLLAAFDQARADAAAVLVTVLGSPGMGKTRLSRELASVLDADERAHTYEIRCDRSGGATFAPFADLIGTAAGIGDETDDGVDARERIAALVTDDTDRARVVDVVAGLLGAAPARSVEETFWAIRRIVESLATARPLVVVIDDIQWAEPKLLDLLEHLAEWVQGAAVLLVCLARPELRDLRPALTEPGRRVADVLALDGLDASATAELAAGLLGSALPAELVDRLPASTDGNPLFVRELVRMLVDDAVIRSRDDGTWELAIDADAIEVPPTIQSLLATRVERLPAVELRILELASVVGAEFSVGAIRELADEPATVPSVLERLRRKELVEPTGSYWGDDPLHRFHHVLIRDAAYRRLLKTTRAELHRRVGQWTDSIAADLVGEQETAIAFHYEQAHRYRIELGTTDDDTDRLGRRAAELLSVAARRALDREDLTSAGALARRALAALPDADVDDRAALLLIACECFLSSGDVAAGAPFVDALAELAGDNEQLGGWAACYRAQLVGLTDPDGVVAAEEVATTAAATLERLDDDAGEAKAHQVRAGLLARLGRVGEAEVVLDLALGAARASDDRRRVTAVLGAAPQAALFGPSPVARAGGRCLDVVRLLRITTASPSVEATSMRCQAVLEALRGRFDVSRSMLASARSSLEELGLRHGLLETDLFTGMVELIADDPGAAIDPLRSAYEGLGTLGVGADAGQAAALLATALLACGETDEAELMAGESEALAGQNLKTAIAWRAARAQVLAARGELDAGTALAAEAVDIAAATDLVLDHADACVVLADLRDTAGDAAGARAARDDARRLYEAKGATVPAERLASMGAEPVTSPSSSKREAPPERSAGGTRSPAADNAASRFMEQLRRAFNDPDPAALGRLLARDRVHDDRRSIVALVDVDDRARVAEFAAASEQGFSFVEPEVIAVRGELLALTRMVARTPAGDESARLSVNELDADGRLAYSALFDDDDLRAAMAELDRRYYVGEGAPFQRVLAAVGRYSVAYERDDMDTVREQLAPDLVMVDHEPARWGSGGRDLFLEMSHDVWTDSRGVNSVLYVNAHALLAVYAQALTSDAGSRYERSGYTVLGIDAAGHIDRVEIFADDDFAAALAVFDEHAAVRITESRGPQIENEATRLARSFVDSLLAGRFDEAARYVHEDVVRVDHTTTVSTPTLHGDDAFWRVVGVTAAVGFAAFDIEPLAVRGERLHLGRTTRRTSDGFEVVNLYVDEIDDDGRCFFSALFDDGDLEAAYAELDERYLAGEGIGHTSAVRVCLAYRDAHGRRDSDAMRDLLAPDFVLADRTRLGWGDGDRDYFDAINRSRDQVTADGVVVSRLLLAEGDAVLTVAEGHDITAEGSDYSWVAVLVFQVGDDDRIHRLEMFDEDDFATARARLDELGAEAAVDRHPVRIENAATRADAHAAELIARGDDAALTGTSLADGFMLEDRRTVVALPDLDAAGVAENFAAMRAQGYTIQTPEPLAVRGDSLCLSRRVARTAGGDESPVLAITELDEQGRFQRMVFFDADDLAAALAELDDRFLSGEGAQHARVLRVCKAFGDANERRDFDAMRDMLSADFVMSDRTRLGYGEGDREYFDAASRTRADVAPSDGVAINRLLRLEGDALLTVAEGHHITAEGSDYSWVSCIVFQVDADDRIRRAEYFDEDDFDAAMDRVHELADVGPVAERTEVQNLATHVHTRVLAAISAGDAEAQRALTARNFALDDRRAVVAVPDQDARGITRYHEVMLEQGYEILPPEPLAVRGERLTLSRVTHRTATGDESILLALIELDDLGLIARATAFDEDDLDRSLAELDARYVAGEAAGQAEVLLACATFKAASTSGDPDTSRDLMSPDFVIVDHTLLGFGTGDRDYYLAMLASWAEVAVASRSVVRRIDVVGGAVLAVQEEQIVAEDGSAFERCRCYVLAVDAAGLIERFELYSEDDVAAALALLDELGSAGPRSARAENFATRLMTKSVELATAHQFDLLRELLADDFVRADHRTGVSAPVANGPDEFVTAYAAWFEVGFDRLSITPLAVRGDRLALARLVWSSADGRTVGFLGVYETNVNGRFVRGEHFDESALDTALAELDARFLAGEGAEHLAVLAAGQAWIEASRAQDVDALRAVTAPGLVCVDQTPLGFGTLDREGLLAATRLRFELSDDDVVIVRSVQVAGSALLAHYAETTTDEGNRYERSACYLLAVDDAGLIDRWEVFGEGDDDRALARLHALGSTAPAAAVPDAVENPVTRLLTRLLDLMNRSENEAAYALDAVAADVVRFDRRHTVSAPTLVGGGGFVDNASAIYQVFGVVHPEPVAVRGDRLALIRLHCGEPDGFTLQLLIIYELDTNGRIVWEADYDEEQLDDALTELDERYLAGEGAEHEYLVRRLGDFRTAQSAGDWDAIEALVAEDFVLVDHRSMGLPESDRAGYVGVMRTSEEQTPGARMIHRSLAVCGDVVSARTGRVGSTPDGFEYEWEQIAVMVWAAGLLRRVELFAVTDAAAAQARFEELAHASRITPYVDNDAVRTVNRAYWLRRFVGPAAAGHLVSRGIAGEDRRHTVSMPEFRGRAGFAHAMDATDAVFSDGADIVPLAVRGQRLALVRDRLRHGYDELEVLNLWEIDEHGRLAHATLFDPDRLADAIDRLEDRHRELAGDAYTEFERFAALGEHALNHRDFDTFEPLLATGFHVIDHRQLALPMDRTAYLDSMRVLIEQAPDFTFFFASLHIEGNVAITRVPFFGTTPEGNRYEWSYVQVAVCDPDTRRALAFEWFDDEQWDDAVACFERWADESNAPAPVSRATSVENTASRRIAEAARGFGADHAGMPNHWADDLVRVDHRRMIGVPTTTTRDEFADAASAFAEVGMTDVTFDALAVRGDRWCLGRLAYSGADFDVRFLAVVGCDERDQIAWIDNFDEDELADALALLDERFLAGDGAGDEYGMQRWADFGIAYRDRDWTALEAMFATDAILADHRSIGQGWGDRGDFIASSRAVVELTPDVMHVVRRLEILGGTLLADGEASGTTTDGSRYSWDYHLVVRFTAGSITCLEIFDASDATAARARFEELGRELRTLNVSPLASLSQPVSAAFAARDWEWIRGRVAPDAQLEDRRSTVSSHHAVGSDAVVDLFCGFADVGFETLDNIPIASRGDRLVLLRRVYRTTGGFELQMLAVVETDADGLMASLVLFDADAIVAALDELEIRYARSGQLTPSERQIVLAFVAVNHRAWHELDAVLAPDISVVDHRRLGFPAGVGKDPLVQELQSLVEQVPDVVVVIERIESAGRAVLAENHQLGTSAAGVVAHWEWHLVFALGGDGHIELMEYFDADDDGEARARARYGELAGRDV